MDKYEIKNAKMGNPVIEIEDHGILTLMISLDYGGSGQGFGGYSLDTYDKKLEKRIGTAWGMEFVRRLLEVFEVSRLDELNGKICRAECSWSNIKRIGHPLKDKWFDPKEDLKFLAVWDEKK